MELYISHHSVQALRKPLRTDVIIAAHAVCVRTTMPTLVLIFKVSQALYTQDEDITLPYSFKCRGKRHLSPLAKVTISEYNPPSLKHFLCFLRRPFLRHLHIASFKSLIHKPFNRYLQKRFLPVKTGRTRLPFRARLPSLPSAATFPSDHGYLPFRTPTPSTAHRHTPETLRNQHRLLEASEKIANFARDSEWTTDNRLHAHLQP